MRRRNPTSEEELLGIEILDLEVAEYEDIIRLKRARELAAQTEPQLTPTAIRKIMSAEGLGVGHDKYKEWEQSGLLTDILSQAKEIARKLYEESCLSIKEVGDALRTEGYPYHNQIIGVWASEGSWVCDPKGPASDAEPPIMDISAFVVLISRMSGKEVDLQNWTTLSKIPLLADHPNTAPWHLLLNFFGKPFIQSMLDQSSGLYRLIDLMITLSGKRHTDPGFLEEIKRPLIEQTGYTPLYLASNFGGVSQNQLFDIAVRVSTMETKVVEETYTKKEEETNDSLNELVRFMKAAKEQAAISREKQLAKEVVTQIKAHGFLKFSEWVRMQFEYPSKRELDFMVDLWGQVPEAGKEIITKYEDILFYCWIGLEDYEVEHRLMVQDTIPTYLTVAVWAYMHQNKIESIDHKDLLAEFCAGKYSESPIFVELLTRCIGFGARADIFRLEDNTVHRLNVERSTIDKLLKKRMLHMDQLLDLPGRNEPCFCGSKRKYKKCCIKYLEGSRFWYDS